MGAHIVHHPRSALLPGGLVATLLLISAPAAAFLDSVNPFADTATAFDGKFIDTLERRAWEPPLQRIMHDRAAQATRGGGSTFGRTRDDWTGQTDAPGETAGGEPLQLADGLTLLRMDKAGLVDSLEFEAFLDGIAERLLAASPVTGLDARVHVTSEAGYGQAAALADGVIGIPVATLRQVESEDELAFVLAHEIAHVLLGHHDLDWFAATRDSLVTTAEIGLGLAVAVGSRFGEGEAIAGEAVKWLLIAQGVTFATDRGLLPSWGREQEDEADLLGFDLLVRAGYNLQGAFDVVAKLEQWEAELAARPDPLDQKRRELEHQIGAAGADGQFDAALQGVTERMVLDLGDALGSIGGSDHRSASARFESLNAYFEREYVDETPPASSALELTRLRQLPAVAELLAHYQAADRAFLSAEQGDYARAADQAKTAVAGSTSRHSWPRYTFYRARLGQADADKAARNLELALEGAQPTLVIYRDLAELYWRTGRREQSMTLLLHAFEEFDKPPALYADLIYRYRRLGDMQKANALAIECRYRDRRAGELCDAALQGQPPGASPKDGQPGDPVGSVLKLFD